MSIRIHSGLWKGTRLRVGTQPGLRPTSSRLRETLANWIRHQQAFTQVLDLFAGSGALGLEVCSNLQTAITFVDCNCQVTRAIKERLDYLRYDLGQVHTCDAYTFLRFTQQKFDLLLLDPPYSLTAIEQLPNHIEQSRRLAQTAYIYFEHYHALQPNYPDNWTLIQHTRVGQVKAGFWRRIVD